MYRDFLGNVRPYLPSLPCLLHTGLCYLYQPKGAMHWQSTSFSDAGPPGIFSSAGDKGGNSLLSSASRVCACRSAIAIRLCWPWPPLSRQILQAFQRVSTNLNKLLYHSSDRASVGGALVACAEAHKLCSILKCLRSGPDACPLYQALPLCQISQSSVAGVSTIAALGRSWPGPDNP